MQIDILCLGGTSVDLIQCPEKPSKFSAFTGGSVTNTAVICAKLGLKVAMLSRVGKDPLGNFAIKFLRSRGVITKGMLRDAKLKTPRAIAKIGKSGNARYTFYKAHPKDLVVPLKTASKDLLKTPKIMHFGSTFSHQKETFQESLKYIKFLKKRGVFISLDPNLRPYAVRDKGATKSRLFKLLKLVNMAKLSLQDMTFLTGQKDPEKALKSAKKLLPCEIVLTLGSKGSMYYSEHHPVSLRAKRSNLIKAPAFKVKISDTIGAGDAFTAGLLYGIAQIGERQFFSNIKPHLVFASAVSALVCTQQGSNKGLKNLKQVKTFLATHNSLA